MNQQSQNINLQQLIQEAVSTALEQSGTIMKNNSKKEDVSTSSAISEQANEMSRLACENRLKRIGR